MENDELPYISGTDLTELACAMAVCRLTGQLSDKQIDTVGNLIKFYLNTAPEIKSSG